MTDRQVQCTLYVDETRTLVIPDGLEGLERTTWRERAISFARTAVRQFEGSTGEIVPDIIDHTLDLRGTSDLLVFQLWPLDIPAPVLVRVTVYESPGIGSIAEELRAAKTSRVEQLITSQVGSGREWIHGETLPGEEAEMLIGLQSCFADEKMCVLVTLDATFPEVFELVVEEVRTIVAGMEVTVNGAPWHSIDVGTNVGTRRDLEVWPEVEGAVEGAV